jgi:hypothetical protein
MSNTRVWSVPKKSDNQLILPAKAEGDILHCAQRVNPSEDAGKVLAKLSFFIV